LSKHSHLAVQMSLIEFRPQSKIQELEHIFIIWRIILDVVVDAAQSQLLT